MKYFRMSYEEVVFKRSYLNLILLNRAIPGYKPFDKGNEEKNINYTGGHRKGEKPKGNKPSEHANDFFMNFM